jgi:hypothetical protein
VQQLDGDAPMEGDVLGDVHNGRGATPDGSQQSVSAAEHPSDRVGDAGHDFEGSGCPPVPRGAASGFAGERALA